MQIDEIRLMFDYNYWANGRILTAGRRLPEEAFTAPAGFSHGGLRGTLVHTLDAEYFWRILCMRGEFAPDLKIADFPTIESVAAYWESEEREMRAYLDRLEDGDLSAVVRYTIPEGETRERLLWQCLYHVVNHGTQHRSEAAAILTTLGESPGDVDFTLFLTGRQSRG